MRHWDALAYMPPRLALALLLVGIGMPAARAQVRVVVDQTPIVFEGQPPLEQGGRVLVPLRGVLERLGAFVRYDAQTKTVIAIRGATNITLPVGSRRALIGDRPVTLDTPAFIANGSVLVPLRFLAEALGARVTWNVAARTVAIDTTAGPAPQDPAPPVDVSVSGTVRAVYPDLAPRRLVMRVPGRNGAPALERTIPLRPNATVSVRRPNTLLAITLDRVRVGDTVEVRQTPEGVATAVEVVARAAEKPAPSPRPGQAAPGSPVFKGEFLEAKRLSPGRWVLKMTDGRLIEVPEDVLVLYGGEKVTVDDLRSGDQLTIAVDPKTKRGTRVVVAVEQ